MMNSIIKLDKKKEILNNPKYENISQQFILLFKRNGLYLSDRFTQMDWFCLQDNFIRLTLTPTKNELLKILTELNETDNPKDLKKLKICVENFIYKACESLIESNNIKNKINTIIKQEKENHIMELKDNLKEEIKIYEENLSKTSNLNLISYLSVSIVSMDNFSKGIYEIKLITNKDIIQHKSKIYNLYENLTISQKNDNIIFRNIIDKNKRTFEKIEFSKSDNESEKNFGERIISGSTLSTISIICTKKNEDIVYEGCLYFHDFLLSSIEGILNAGKKFIKTINLPLTYETEKTSMLLEFEINFDCYTLHGIFKRILYLYELVLEQKNICYKNVDEVLEFFPEISETVKNYLNNIHDEKRDACCNCFII
jgi:hypothetical protein